MPITLNLKEELGRLEAGYPLGSSGIAGAAALSDCVDRAIGAIWESEGGPVSGCALVAVGGYGRRHMCPQSDIDLLVLIGKRVNVTQPVKGLSYALWDMGFELGLSTATVKEAQRLAATDIDTRCAHLDSRLVCGDAALFDEFSQSSLQAARRSSKSFVERLRQLSGERWLKAGDAGAELEPDLKRSKGALRDIAVLGWIRAVSGANTAPVQQNALNEALDLLLTVRQGLHYETRRPTDLLSMQVQIPVARRLGLDEYELMRRLYESCRPVAFAAEAVLLGPDPLWTISETFARSFPFSARAEIEGRRPRTEVSIAGKKIEEGSEAASRDSGSPSAGQMGANETPPSEWPGAAREAFFEILRAGAEGRRAFRAIDVTGALTAALPEWSQVRHRAQRNIYHRWAVDVHCHEAVCELVQLMGGNDDLAQEVARDSKDHWDTLLLAGLLHDIGKGAGEDHSVLGERLADSCSSRIGLRASASRDVAWLVRNHLLLAQVATRRDISEEALIVDLAERVGSERRLRMLYLLSIADARATGPEAWTAWKADLVTQLFSEVNHLLERKELVGGDATRKAAARAAELRESLGGPDTGLVDKHLATMPRAWLLSQDPAALQRQSRWMLKPLTGPIHLEARPQGPDGVWEVTVVAQDRPGLFSKVSGVLALHGYDVVSAQIFTREDGLALEIFRVEAPPGREDRFERVAVDAERAILGTLSLAEALSRKRRDYAGRVEKGKQEPPEVIVDNRASDFYTVIEVHATDRIGLLYEITSALADLGLDIHLAKVATSAEDVVDSFYVRDLDGQKVTDPARLGSVQSEVLARVLSAGPDTI